LSRIGKKAIAVPAGVEVKMNGQSISVKGTKGTLTRVLPESITVNIDKGAVSLTTKSQADDAKAQWGLYRVLVANMVQGVSEGYRKQLDVVGVGYKAELKGKELILTVGLSHLVNITPPAGVKVTVEDINKTSRVTVEGADKEAVGQIAAEIRASRPPEPYQGKGVRYVGEHIIRKVGKQAGK